MKILEIRSLEIPEVRVIKFERFLDYRGYFTEHYRSSDLAEVIGLNIQQCNESYSKKYVMRGLHFQWDPYMGKLIRTVSGHMVDMILDIRKGSPTFGNIILYDMPVDREKNYQEWIWVPVGFAHGNFFLKDTTIEYLCSGEYSKNESGVSPLSDDINWSLCNKNMRDLFVDISSKAIISEKDKKGLTITQWLGRGDSNVFVY
jgi:dTDP-4-dehydrorhamnose 3,5-epimerase